MDKKYFQEASKNGGLTVSIFLKIKGMVSALAECLQAVHTNLLL